MPDNGENFTGAEAAKRPSPRSRDKSPLTFKTYIVLQRSFKRDPHKPNTRVIAVKLTQDAAQKVVDEVPGSWWERHLANKLNR